MNIVKTIDDYMCDALQRFSDWSQVHVGLSCIAWAMICTLVEAVCFLGWSRIVFPPFFGGIFALAFLSVMIIVANYSQLHRLKIIFSACGDARRVSPYRFEEEGWRVFRLLLIIVTVLLFPLLYNNSELFGVLLESFFASSLLYDYFIACSPLPPGASRPRKLANRLSAA